VGRGSAATVRAVGDASGYVTPALERWRRWSDGPLTVLAIGTLPFLLLELVSDDLPDRDRVLIVVVNVVVLIAFAVDYLVELVLARSRGRYVRSEWSSALIVVAQAIAVVPGLGAFGVLRAARGARALRAVVVVARLLAVGGAAAGAGREWLRRNAANVALGVAGLTWLTSAVGFTLAEDVGVDGRVSSFFDALWWSTTTITTVGYGDVYPVTAAGRLIGAVTMIVGISTFAVVTAKVAELLVRVDRSRQSS
jgi:voltage-gated potassium channel